uniref:Uncharacterized protein n=1 Tax=Vespula pensylvanica TaxID=30213 RepID=A0A834PGY1_VESPE|nr:hypothetical protein H0235_001726 [Vespula pensylvanica]
MRNVSKVERGIDVCRTLVVALFVRSRKSDLMFPFVLQFSGGDSFSPFAHPGNTGNMVPCTTNASIMRLYAWIDIKLLRGGHANRSSKGLTR